MHKKNILERIRRPTRYLGNEVNSVHKPREEIRVHIALAYPDLYEVGMSHLGLKILYGLANTLPGVYAERVFAPAADLEKILREEELPLFSLETWTPLHEFELVGFTLQYELNFTTVLNMLQLGNIPLHAEKRTEEDPFVIGGGPGSFNPEPLAPFFDIFVIGDGEEALEEIVAHYEQWKKHARRDRKNLLKGLASLQGIYVPSFYRPQYSGGRFSGMETLVPEAPPKVEKRVVKDLENTFYPGAFIVPYLEVVHDRASLELFRGCAQGCRFCQAGFVYRPLRERSPEKLTRQAKDIIEKTGYEELSLSSLSSSDYPYMEELLDELEKIGGDGFVRLSLPSLRADTHAVKLSNRVQEKRGGGVTFAPEAGSQRLRNVINKKVTDQEILDATREAFLSGRNHVKLYFMIGLPEETDEDLLGIAELAQKMRELSKAGNTKGKRPFKVNVSISNFVPKAATPFQWDPQETPEELKRRQDLLRTRFNRLKGASLSWHEVEISVLEAVFSRGDRKLSSLLERAHSLGSRLDAWSDMFDFGRWNKAFQLEGIDPADYARYRPSYEDPLPWDHIGAGVSKKFLIREREKALKGEITPSCREKCAGCGVHVCAGGGMKQDVQV